MNRECFRCLCGWLFLQEDQFLFQCFAREDFGFKDDLASSFQIGRTILFGQFENAQAGAIGLRRIISGLQSSLDQRIGLWTNFACPFQQLVRVDLVHELVILWHVRPLG